MEHRKRSGKRMDRNPVVVVRGRRMWKNIIRGVDWSSPSPGIAVSFADPMRTKDEFTSFRLVRTKK